MSHPICAFGFGHETQLSTEASRQVRKATTGLGSTESLAFHMSVLCVADVAEDKDPMGSTPVPSRVPKHKEAAFRGTHACYVIFV